MPKFPWLHEDGLVFLNHGSFGATPLPVLERQNELRLQIERDPIRFLIDELEGRLDEVRGVVGARFGADPDGIAFVPNPTFAVNSVLASLRLSPGDEIVVTDHGYNACNNAAKHWAERSGAKAVVAEVPFPIRDPAEVTASVVAALGPRTRLVIIDHVTSPTGLVFPVADIVREAEARNIDAIVDGAHAPGMLPLDISSIGAAYYVGALHKWVCAPKGASFVVTRADRRTSMRPAIISHGANSMRTDRSRYALEFDWTGTMDPTPFLAVPAALELLDTFCPDGLTGVMRENRELALAARALLMDRLGLEPPCPESMTGSLVAFPLPDGDPVKLHRRLRDEHHIQVPVMPWPAPGRRVFRVSAQRYNVIDQYETLAAALLVELERERAQRS
ncbi:MAG: aminotransferase class V-fold PLP-dependent enzyme [Polyangiaceae bacterium]|nr:aminotransferase class V-fold PLP-dependent enzyme [Polyangiaceae bacterium]